MAQTAAAALSGWALVLIGILAVLLAAAVLLVVRLARRLWAAQTRAAQLAELIEAVPDQGLLLLDAAGCVRHWSAGAERLHGYRAAEMLGQHYACLFTAEDRRSRVAENELEATARDGPHGARGLRVHRDGRYVTVDAHLQALRDDSGLLAGFSVVERDLSERLAQEQALAEARAMLAGVQKLTALGRLSEGIAHEFNNIVHVVKTAVELLQRRWAPDAQGSDLLSMIKRNADRGGALSQHLLALARRQPLLPVATDVNEVVGAVAALLRQTLNENIVVEEQLDEALSWVMVDRSELEAALLHVAANARDAMSAGGRLIFSTAEVLQPAEPAEPAESAERADDGRPVRHSVLIRIQDAPGDAAAQVEPAAGTGAPAAEASLELVRALVQHSHGQLQIERQGMASTVNLYLPCRAG